MEVRERVDRVATLIEGFETPYGMELLATVHWVATHDKKVKSVDEAVAAVHRWNESKRKILKDQHSRLAWNALEQGSWI